MKLIELLSLYESDNTVSKRYREGLLRTVRKCEANGLLDVCQLAPVPVNQMLLSLKLSPTTVANIRRELLTLWRFAFDRHLTDEYPRGVRRVTARHAPPQCWTMDEMRRLLAAAGNDCKQLSSRHQTRRCDILPGWISIAYDTALRFSDVHQLRSANIRNGCVCTVAAKTGKPVMRALGDYSRQQAAQLVKRSPDGTLFLWCLPRRRALLMWRAFLDEHGFGGSSKWLRRAAATQVELREPGAAWRFLQHTNQQLAVRHYLDGSQLAVTEPPPQIMVPAEALTGSAVDP
jgi:integrase